MHRAGGWGEVFYEWLKIELSNGRGRMTRGVRAPRPSVAVDENIEGSRENANIIFVHADGVNNISELACAACAWVRARVRSKIDKTRAYKITSR